MKKFISKSLDEMETIIIPEYTSKTYSIYSSRPATMRKLYKILGNPNKKVEDCDGIYSMEWKIPFDSRENIKKSLSVGVLLPPKKKADN